MAAENSEEIRSLEHRLKEEKERSFYALKLKDEKISKLSVAEENITQDFIDLKSEY